MWDELLQVRGLYVLRSDTLAICIRFCSSLSWNQAAMSRTSSQSLSGTHLWRLSCLCITSVDTRKQTVLQFDKMESSVSLSCCCSHWSSCLLLGQESFLSFHPEDKDHHAVESSALDLLHWSSPLKGLSEELPGPLLPALCHQSESLLALSSVDLDQEVRTPSWK